MTVMRICVRRLLVRCVIKLLQEMKQQDFCPGAIAVAGTPSPCSTSGTARDAYPGMFLMMWFCRAG